MGQGIEGDPAKLRRRGIAATPSHPGVGDLVGDDPEDQGHKGDGQALDAEREIHHSAYRKAQKALFTEFDYVFSW